MTEVYLERPMGYNPGTNYEEVEAAIRTAAKGGRKEDLTNLLRLHGGIINIRVCLNYQRWTKQLELELMEDFLNYKKFSKAKS